MPLEKPQRLTPPAAPGVLLKRFNAPHMRLRLAETSDRDPVYLKLIRACPCLCCGMEPSEAAHVRMASASHGKASGMGKLPPDRWAAPLCAADHRLAKDAQHKGSERQFWNRLGIPILLVCEKLWRARGDLVAMRAVALVAIAGRTTR